MISVPELRKKALNKYPDILKAALRGEDVFPIAIPANLSLKANEQSNAAKQVQTLASNSKENLGYGYSIEWTQRNSRHFGKNDFPAKIYFETRNDMLRFIKKAKDFKAFEEACFLVKAEFPELASWLEGNLAVVQKRIVPNVKEFIKICGYLKSNPQPECFVRELPISVETKFAENNEAILRQWLDLILPPSAIQSHEDDFYLRFGLLKSRNHYFVRILDENLYDDIAVNHEEFSLPFDAMRKLTLDGRIFIVENKTNLLTFPRQTNSLALGGLGNGVLNFRYFNWLHKCQIYYWGDIDIEGFEILSRLRLHFPQTKSIFMDTETYSSFQQLATTGNAKQAEVPFELTPEEKEIFEYCRDNNIRLEQEKIPQSFLNEYLSKIL